MSPKEKYLENLRLRLDKASDGKVYYGETGCSTCGWTPTSELEIIFDMIYADLTALMED